MKDFFNIIRWQNLLIVLFLQCLMILSVIFPLFQTYGFETSGYNFQIIFLITSTLFITAGGYVINDYFDVKIDRINKPDKVIIGNSIESKQAILIYQIVTTIGIALGIILAFWVNNFTLGFIFLIVPGMLWFYSASYKRQFLIGNIIVSLSAALSVLLTGIFGVSLLKMQYHDLIAVTPIPNQIYAWIGGFSAFAFIITLIREIIKDAEDIEGDRELECRTLPIKWGIKKTKVLLFFLILLMLSSILFIQFRIIPFDDIFSLKYVLIGLVFPLLVLIVLVFKSQSSSDWHKASQWSKLIMLIGILYSLVFYYLQAKKYNLILFGIFIINQ